MPSVPWIFFRVLSSVEVFNIHKAKNMDGKIVHLHLFMYRVVAVSRRSLNHPVLSRSTGGK
jgi:hypothetical protein